MLLFYQLHTIVFISLSIVNKIMDVTTSPVTERHCTL